MSKSVSTKQICLGVLDDTEHPRLSDGQLQKVMDELPAALLESD